MKKFKILPSVLMLIVCIAIFGVGVFAISPTKNTISGTITINSSNAPVEIQLLIDDNKQGDPVIVRSGYTFNIGELVFNTTGINSLIEVRDRKVTLNITNLSTTQPLGVYFYNGTPLTNDMADVENILLEKNIYATGDEEIKANQMATAYFTPYYYLAKNDGNTTNDVISDFEFDNVDMCINFECYQLFSSKKTYNFDFTLNIEPYVGNVGNSDLVQTEPVWDEDNGDWNFENMYSSRVKSKLIKIKEEVKTIPMYAFYNNSSTDDHMIVIPSSVTEVVSHDFEELSMGSYECFEGLGKRKAMSINAYLDESSSTWGDGNGIKGFFGAEVVATNVCVPGGSTAERVCDRVEVSSNVLKLSDVAFEGTVSKLIVCNGIKSIGSDALMAISKMVIPSSVTTIYEGVLDYLSVVTIRAGMDLNEKYLFYDDFSGIPEDSCWYTEPYGAGEKVYELSAETYQEDVTYYCYNPEPEL